MQITLYTTKSPNNYIGKTLENPIEITCNFKGIADYKNPVIELYRDSVITSNYCYIPDLNRYYYIKDVQILPNGYYVLSLQVDVLESWKADILNSTCRVKRQSDFNNYYDSDFATQINKTATIYKSTVTISDTKTNILVTIGG